MLEITRKIAICGCLLFTGFCFWKAGMGLIGGADTEILPSAQAAMSPSLSPSRVVTPPIQQMRPGMRIVGRNPLRIQTEPIIDPTPEGWRLVSVRMLKEDGTYFEAELLRPLSWIYRHYAQPGAVIQLNMPEMYVVGTAEVLSISDCPPIDPGDGPVVISTFKNVSHNVLNLYVEGETEPIGVTAGHPIWSEDRQAFVHTDQLQPGEHLRSAVGKTVRITSIEIRAGPEPVYNLEIAGEHVYSVTDSGLLVHNSGPCDLVPRGYYDSGYIGIVNGSADEFSDTLRATFGTYDVLPSSRLVSQADTVGGVGLGSQKIGTSQGVFTNRVEWLAPKGTEQLYTVFQRNDIDWAFTRSTDSGVLAGRGLTNAEAAAKQGLGPILPDGYIATLHHSQQKSIGPLFKASTRYHNFYRIDKAPLHPNGYRQHPDFPMGSGRDPNSIRSAFQNHDSLDYWKWRG
ncbi:polymorphic toxin-type HINT domain-containing protein [Gimesia maris]|uniref:polymorphic toxin-type HINT domain-containing protein n=1 Tax=Gimesia maris TaxID=122 RepID=UPI0012BA1F8C|nr:polymorphic toxin-type HINT domain-containing protein [Gimesia maris]